MNQFEERTVAGLRVRIDRTLCVAFETCIDAVPEVFRFDDEGIVTFVPGEYDVAQQRILEAIESCPVDALSIIPCENSALTTK